MGIAERVDTIIEQYVTQTGSAPLGLCFSLIAWDQFRDSLEGRQMLMIEGNAFERKYRGIRISVNPEQAEGILIIGAAPHVAKRVEAGFSRPLQPGQLEISRDGCGVKISMMFKDEYEAIAHADSWALLAKSGRLSLTFNLMQNVNDDV